MAVFLINHLFTNLPHTAGHFHNLQCLLNNPMLKEGILNKKNTKTLPKKMIFFLFSAASNPSLKSMMH
jgi:hypothetical protein